MSVLDRDLAVLEILVPHLIVAFSNAKFIHRLAGERDLLDAAFESAQNGIMTIDSGFKVIQQNLTAIKLLREFFSPLDKLPEELIRYVKYCGDLFSAAEVYVPPAPLVIEKFDSKLEIRLAFQTQTQTIVIFLEEVRKPSSSRLNKTRLDDARSGDFILDVRREN